MVINTAEKEILNIIKYYIYTYFSPLNVFPNIWDKIYFSFTNVNLFLMKFTKSIALEFGDFLSFPKLHQNFLKQYKNKITPQESEVSHSCESLCG